jgi:hypothetical protein
LMNMLPPSSKLLWSKNSIHIGKWICSYVRHDNCSSKLMVVMVQCSAVHGNCGGTDRC